MKLMVFWWFKCEASSLVCCNLQTNISKKVSDPRGPRVLHQPVVRFAHLHLMDHNATKPSYPRIHVAVGKLMKKKRS